MQRVNSRQSFTNKNEVSAQNTSPSFKSQDLQYDQRPPLRAVHFTKNSSPQNEQQENAKSQTSLSGELAPPASHEAPGMSADLALAPGTLLRGGRYRITNRHNYQQWGSNAYEVHWQAQDLQGGANVLICEMRLPEVKVAARQASLRTAMKVLFSAGTHPQIPTLTNVFRESGRDFFVFAAIEGESLLKRMQRTGQTLQEQEVIECCLQVTEILEVISRQEPPLLHGLINPENILNARSGQWLLTNFSTVLASGANQYLAGIDPSLLSPFASPDIVDGIIDSRIDVYSLLATAYYATTGHPPGRTGGDLFQRGQGGNPAISPSFRSILMKGLHPLASQRYQQPSLLRQDLLSLRPVISTAIPMSGQPGIEERLAAPGRQRQSSWEPMKELELPGSAPAFTARREEPASLALQQMMLEKQPASPARQGTVDPVAKALSSLALPDELDEPTKELLPRPEELPPMPQGNDMLAATLWMVGILICLLIPIIIR